MSLTTSQKLLKANQPDKARDALPPSGTATDPRIDLWRARIDLETGASASALETLADLAQRSPAYPPVELFSGIAYWDQKNYEQARRAFERVLDLQPENVLAKSYVGLCELTTGKTANAADIWRKAGLSDNLPFRVRLIEYLETQWIEHRAFFAESEQTPIAEPLKVSKSKALSAFYKRDFAGMLRHVPPPPGDADIFSFLAATGHEMLRNYSHARTYLDAMESQKDQWPEPLIALNGRLLTREGKLAEAAQEFSKVLILGPEDFGINYYLGVICLAYEKQVEARQYFSRALSQYMVDTLEFQWWQIEQILLPSR